MKNKFTINHINVSDNEVLYDGFMQLSKITFDHELYQGGVQQDVSRELLKRGRAVGVLLYDNKNETFVFIEQVRIGALEDKNSPWLLEIVAGMVEVGEEDDSVARRESAEEAGATIKTLIPIQEYWVSPGGSDEQVALFLGIVDSTKVSDFAGLNSEHEDIKVILISKSETLNKLQSGHINNSMALIALQWFFLNESRLEL